MITWSFSSFRSSPSSQFQDHPSLMFIDPRADENFLDQEFSRQLRPRVDFLPRQCRAVISRSTTRGLLLVSYHTIQMKIPGHPVMVVQGGFMKSSLTVFRLFTRRSCGGSSVVSSSCCYRVHSCHLLSARGVMTSINGGNDGECPGKWKDIIGGVYVVESSPWWRMDSFLHPSCCCVYLCLSSFTDIIICAFGGWMSNDNNLMMLLTECYRLVHWVVSSSGSQQIKWPLALNDGCRGHRVTGLQLVLMLWYQISMCAGWLEGWFQVQSPARFYKLEAGSPFYTKH